MQKSTKILIGIATAVWLFYAVGFGMLGLLGFFADASEKGFRATLCGTGGCGDRDYYLSVVWLSGVIIVIYILPILAVIYFVRKRRKGRA